MIYKYSEFLLEFKRRSEKSDDLEDFSDLYIERIAEKLGVKLIKRLGKGSFGIAYLADKNKVIKVTTDVQEAENAKRLSDLELEYFLNYYDVFEMTLDNIEYSEGKKVYFILMDYVRPLQGKEKEYWGRWYEGFFGNYSDEDFLDEVWTDYTWESVKDGNDPTEEEKEEADKAVEYFKPFLKRQRWKMIDEATDYGIEFSDAHAGNLGIRKSDGAIIYFDIGYYDKVTVEDSDGDEVKYDIQKMDFENDFEKIKNMVISKYEPKEAINVKDLISDISKLLNINKIKAYKYLRDEIYFQNKQFFGSKHKSPIFFVAKVDDKYGWEESFKLGRFLQSDSIKPDWKKEKFHIAVVFNETYKDTKGHKDKKPVLKGKLGKLAKKAKGEKDSDVNLFI